VNSKTRTTKITNEVAKEIMNEVKSIYGEEWNFGEKQDLNFYWEC
jgi:hypothetical protein